MNYIIEGNIDFYKELEKQEEDLTPENVCLISQEKLDENQTIKLMCGHKFNYLPLFKEITNQKKNHNVLEVKRLLPMQIKCPYCRNIQNKILPFIPSIEGVTRLWGVNYPAKWEMKNYLNTCNYIFKSGKKKDMLCGKPCYSKKCSAHTKIEIPDNFNNITCETLDKYTITQLKNICKITNIKGYSKLRKSELLELIKKDLNKD